MVSVSELAVEFYTVEALILDMEDKKVHVSIKNQVNAYRRKLHHAMRYLFRDYMLTACFGEARHALGQCKSFIPELTLDDRAIKNRTDAGKLVTLYTVESLLVSLKALFAEEWQSYSFGGAKWGTAIRAFDLWERPAVFLDHVFDLKHNGSTLFSKSDYGLISVGDYGNLQEYLSQRFTMEPNVLVKRYFSSSFNKPTPELLLLLNKAYKTNIKPKQYSNNFDYLWNYKPLVFGKIVLSLPIDKGSRSIHGCNNCSVTFLQKLNEHFCSLCLPDHHECCNRCETAYKLTIGSTENDKKKAIVDEKKVLGFDELTQKAIKSTEDKMKAIDEKEKETKSGYILPIKFNIDPIEKEIQSKAIKALKADMDKFFQSEPKISPSIQHYLEKKEKAKYDSPKSDSKYYEPLNGIISTEPANSKDVTDPTPRPTVS